MSNNLKTLILLFLQNLPEDRSQQYNKAFEFYKQLPNKSRQAEVNYNRAMTDQSLKNLLYDLKKLANISDVELHSAPVEPEMGQMKHDSSKLDVFKQMLETLEKSAEEKLLELLLFVDGFGFVVIDSKEQLRDYFQDPIATLLNFKESNPEFVIDEVDLKLENLVEYAKELIVSVQFSPELSQLITDLQLVPESPSADQMTDSKNQFLEELSDSAKQLIVNSMGSAAETEPFSDYAPLRTQFPFLNDADCPNIMYVVVGRRIAAFNAYGRLHAKLQSANAGEIQLSAEEKEQLTIDCEAAFTDNRKLWDELEHYGANKTILGKHVLFREDNIKKEVELMTNDDLFKFRASSSKYFHDQKKALEKFKNDADKIAVINQRIEDRTYKLALVNAKIGG